MIVRHIVESELALFLSGDLPLWKHPAVRLHLLACPACRETMEAYREDRLRLRRIDEEMPVGIGWERLAAEMAANIRVGLAAGECVAPRSQPRSLPAGWRIAATVAGFSALLVSAWWLNMPPAENAALGAAMKKIVRVFPWPGGIPEDRGPMVEVSASGIQLRENGGVLGMSQGLARPVSVTLSVQGSARAHYVDSETGQVTITGVYAQ